MQAYTINREFTGRPFSYVTIYGLALTIERFIHYFMYFTGELTIDSPTQGPQALYIYQPFSIMFLLLSFVLIEGWRWAGIWYGILFGNWYRIEYGIQYGIWYEIDFKQIATFTNTKPT